MSGDSPVAAGTALAYEVRDRVAWLTLDDGGPNALNTEIFNAFFAALDAAEADEDVGSVVIAGREGFFSAGMDLKWMQTIDRDALGTIGPDMARLAHRIFIFPKPVIAAVEGHAIAGGAVILLACDRSVGATGSYKIGLNEVAIGIPFGGFAMDLARAHLVPSAFGAGLLHGSVYEPARAYEVGYLDELVEPGAVRERAGQIAAEAARLNSFAYTMTKQAMRGDLAATISEQAESGMLVPLFQAFADLRAGGDQ
ncbi:MAG: crotonase/enoyl-CoA hydratase family protein [Actinobacteria bacterium]|nr:crotonase/enoyl-CoA hydratase family protein [Actinomycetota bacterium]